MGPICCMHKFNQTTKWLFQLSVYLSQIVVVSAAAISQSVSQSVQPAAGRMQVGTRGGSAGCNQPDQGLLGQVGSATSSPSWWKHLPPPPPPSPPPPQIIIRCCVWVSGHSQLLSTASEQAAAWLQCNQTLCFYLGMVGDTASCAVDTKHKLQIFVFSFGVALLSHASPLQRASSSAFTASPHALHLFSCWYSSVYKWPGAMWCHVIKSSDQVS